MDVIRYQAIKSDKCLGLIRYTYGMYILLSRIIKKSKFFSYPLVEKIPQNSGDWVSLKYSRFARLEIILN